MIGAGRIGKAGPPLARVAPLVAVVMAFGTDEGLPTDAQMALYTCLGFLFGGLALLYPKAAGEGVYDRLEAACQEGGSSFYTSGIDPGYGVELPGERIAEVVNHRSKAFGIRQHRSEVAEQDSLLGEVGNSGQAGGNSRGGGIRHATTVPSIRDGDCHVD